MRALTYEEKECILEYALERMEPTGGQSAYGNGMFWGLILASGGWLGIILMLAQALEKYKP